MSVPSSTRSLLIRADADARVGTGHVMRCLALAQAWQDAGGSVSFICSNIPSGLKDRLTDESILVIPSGTAAGGEDDARQCIAEAQACSAVWVIVDGYQFGSDYQRWLKAAGLQVLFVDDYGHGSPYFADLVLNQNLHAQESLYSQRAPSTRLLLGSRYALLRREFRRWIGFKRSIPSLARNILVTMGGSDPDNVTLKVIHALTQLEPTEFEIRVVVGAANPHVAALHEAANVANGRVQLLCNVAGMPELMAWADLAVSAAGSTCWELLLLGVPTITLILADNQNALATALTPRGLCMPLGWAGAASTTMLAESIHSLAVDSARRHTMAQAGQEVVDGEGTRRTLQAMSKPRLRSACEEDCRLLWEWRNAPDVRAASFSALPIPYETHAQWFASRLADPNCRIFIGIDGSDVPIGQVRVEIAGRESEIHVSVVRDKCGQGVGSHLIRLASDSILNEGLADEVHAMIRPDNQRSAGAFENAGFILIGQQTVKGHAAMHLVKYANQAGR